MEIKLKRYNINFMGALRNIAIPLIRDILNSDVSLIMLFRSFVEIFFEDGITVSVIEKTILYIIDFFNIQKMNTNSIIN